jgi:glycosyltransferase involved in cell wall biosynthesis
VALEPTLGVCIPTFEGAGTLAATLASIAHQERPADEVLVLDDGSSDGTLDVAEQFRGRIPGLRIERNRTRLGIVGNPNRCLALATADWVVVMGQDDVLHPAHLARKASWAVGETGMVVCGRHYAVAEELVGIADYDQVARAYVGLDVGDATLSPARFTAALAGRLSLNAIGEPVTVLLRRDLAVAIGGFDPAFRQLWDLDLWLRLGAIAPSAFLRDPLCTFRVHLAGASYSHINDYSVMYLEQLRLRTKVLHDPAYQPLHEALRRRRREPVWVDAAVLAHRARRASSSVHDRRTARRAWRSEVDELFRGHLRPLRRPALLGLVALGGRAIRRTGGTV